MADKTNRPAPTPHSGQTPIKGPGKVTPIPVPPRNPALNDTPTSGGAGNLGKAS
jgi:hypothetical protein